MTSRSEHGNVGAGRAVRLAALALCSLAWLAAATVAHAQAPPLPGHPWLPDTDHTFQDHSTHDESADLDARGVDLSGGSLDDALFERGRLDDTTLVGLTAQRADFDLASFLRADMSQADFTDAQFDNAVLIDAVLTTSTFDGAVMDFATLDGADAGCPLDSSNVCDPLEVASFRGVSLEWGSARGAIFDYAILQGSPTAPTDLSQADLTDASFVAADLTRSGSPGPTERTVSLAGAVLRGADFTCASAAWANLRGVTGSKIVSTDPELDLTLVDFTDVNLRLADLSDARLGGAMFANADLSDALLADMIEPCYVEEVDDGDPMTPAPVLPACVTPTPDDGDPSTPIIGQTICADFQDAVLSRAVLAGSDLSGVTGFANNAFLDGVNFAGTTLVGVDFGGANLADAILISLETGTNCKADTNCPTFLGATMTGVVMSGIDFDDIGFVFQQVGDPFMKGGPDMSGADLSGSIVRSISAESTVLADLSDMVLEDVDLSGAIAYAADFQLARLRGADFEDATVYCSDFRGAQLEGARFDGAVLCEPVGTAPDFVPTVCPDPAMPADQVLSGSVCANFVGASVAASGSLPGASFEGVTFPTTETLSSIGLDELSGTTLDDAIFDGVDLTGVSFVGASLADARLVEATGLASALWSGADLSGAVLHGSDFGSADLRTTILDSVSLCDTNALCAQLGAAQLAGTSTASPGARMRGVDFRGLADPSDLVEPYDSQLKGADLSYMDLQFADLRDLDFDLTSFVGTLLGRADLRGAGINGADFTDARLDNANLTGAILPGPCAATFTGAVLTGAIWRDARFDLANCLDLATVNPDLRFVDFGFSTLSTATDPANLPGIWLSHAHLSGITMIDADLTGAVLEAVDLRCRNGDSVCAVVTNTDFGGATMRAADLRGVVLDDSQFVGTNLIQARLDGASLDAADLGGAMLDQAKLLRASLVSANLAGATLDAADLSEAVVHDVDFAGLDLLNTTLDRVSLCDTGPNGMTISLCATLVGANVVGVAGDLGVRMRGVDFSVLGPDPTGFIDPDLRFTDLQLSSFASLDFSVAPFLFEGADLQGADFNHADLNGVDFRMARLDGATFTDVALDPMCTTQFDGAVITGLIWHGVRFDQIDCFDFHSVDPDLRGVDFTDGTIRVDATTGVDLAGFDLSDAILRGADLSDADLGNALLSGADLGYANVGNVVFAGADLADALLYGVDFSTSGDLQGATLDSARLCEFDEDGTTPLGACTNFAGAGLAGTAMTPGVRMRSVDFRVLADDPTSTVTPKSWQLQGEDLSFSDLSNASLVGLDLAGMNFEGAILDGALLRSAGLDDVVFKDASLVGAVLSDAELTAACTSDFDGALLRGVFWRDARLDLATCFDFATIQLDLRDADFSFSVIGRVTGPVMMKGVDLSGATLVETDFTGVDLTGAILDRANLSGAILTGAVLDSVPFVDANFSQGAQDYDVGPGSAEKFCIPFPGTDPVDLTGADLSNADFSQARHFLPGCIDFDATTVYTAETKFPSGFPADPDMTLVPEPAQVLMQASVLGALAWLRRRRRTR